MIYFLALFLILSTPTTCKMDVGWAFKKGGGFPVIPWNQKYGSVQSSTIAYFAGNASGPDSDTELQAEAQFGMMGLGWQLSNIPSNHSHLEKYEVETARALKKLNPNIKILVTREIQVVTYFWDFVREVMEDPKYNHYWITGSDGKPVQGSWWSPAGNTPKYWLNFSNPNAVTWWENKFIGSAINTPEFDGIYSDCACENAPGVAQAELDKIQADAQIAFDKLAQKVAAAGKWYSAWNDAGTIDQGSCQSRLSKWIKYYGTHTNNTLQIFFDYRRPNQYINSTVAAFLIVRGPSATIMWPVIGAYEKVQNMPYNKEILNRDYGIPIDHAHVSGQMWSRKYSKYTITLDCETFKATFTPTTNLSST